MEFNEISQHFPGFGQMLSQSEDDRLRMDILMLSVLEQRRKAMKGLRGAMGYSAKRFGSMCGVTQQYIFAMESGRASWSKARIDKFNESLKKQFACPADSEPAEQAGLADPKGAEC